MFYEKFDTVYDVTLPENEQELEIFQGLYEAYSQATSQHRFTDRVEAVERSKMPTVSDAASTTTFNLDEVVLRHSAQPKDETK